MTDDSPLQEAIKQVAAATIAANVARRYYTSLLDVGFEREEALALVARAQDSLVMVLPGLISELPPFVERIPVMLDCIREIR